MLFEQENENEEQENLQEILEELVLVDNSNTDWFIKTDNTIFIVDCSPELFQPLPGETQTQFEKILLSYGNFMKSKIIANSSDRVGLILFNVENKNNKLNFDNIYTVHDLEIPSASRIRSVAEINKNFQEKYGSIIRNRISLHHVLWIYGHEIKDLQGSRNHLRLFLFTCNDCPHPQGDERREQAINHARQLATKNVEIQLFPIKASRTCAFDVRNFYQQIITFEKDGVNETTIDESSKILNLQSRLRQKEYKKRTLNRILMKVGRDTYVGVKIFSLYAKAKRPLAKKLQASTNKPLVRNIHKINRKGQILYNEQIGTFYPLGGEKIPLTKADVAKLKSIEEPGIVLIGFKPERFIKPHYNLRTSYFLYPDEEYVGGSSQFFDALIDELKSKNLIGIVKVLPRANQQLRLAAIFAQKQEYDVDDHFQTPPGLNMIFLPFADDIVEYSNNKTITPPQQISTQLSQATKLLINNLTINDFDFRNFSNPALQKFYHHLQGHALNDVKIEEFQSDTLQPDTEGFSRSKDVVELIRQTVSMEVEESDSKKQRKSKMQRSTKSESVPKRKKEDLKTEKKSAEEKEEVVVKVEDDLGDGYTKDLTEDDLRTYLKIHQLNSDGTKEEMVDRIMVYISHKANI